VLIMLAKSCIRIAGLYLLLGMGMGIAMGATENFALRPVHAHVNLLGWVTLSIVAGVYRLWPQLAQTRWAYAFFWTYNISLPTTMGALTLFLLGHGQALPVLVLGEIGLFAAATMLVASLFTRSSTQATEAPDRMPLVAGVERAV
jgi:hypothetical protein